VILDKDQTKITIEEMSVEDITLMDAVPNTVSRYWYADLDGVGPDGEIVRMSRNGSTPDDALRKLFEAMHAARVTL